MSAFSRFATLLLTEAMAAIYLVGAPPGGSFASAPAGHIAGYSAPSHFPAPLGLRPTTSGFTGINPGALPTSRFGYGSRSNYGRGSSLRGRDYRGLPVGYFFAPYYYPGLLYGSSDYDTGEYGGSPYYGAADPVSDSLAAGQGYLGHQIQQLNEQVDQLQYAQQAGQPIANGSAQAEPSQPEQPPVTLVLRNGQQLQVKNYAVMAEVFWDFSSPIAKKIPIANIDIPASARATEAQGGEFPTIGQ